MVSRLELARDNHVFRLQTALEVLGKEFNPAAFVMVSACYRVLGACAALLDCDAAACNAYLRKAAYARLAFLERARGAPNVEPQYLCCSKDLGFTCALAADDWPTAQEIASLSEKTHCASVEYEDDFLFFHFMHAILLHREDTALATSIIGRWGDVLQGAESGHFDVCNAMANPGENDFESAFESMVATRAAQLDVYAEQVSADPELLAVERGLFIDAVAILRLAGKCGLSVTGSYKGVPHPVLLKGTAPPPGRTSWMAHPH